MPQGQTVCVCVCMWERETWSYLYVTVGKHLSITRGENWNINSKSTCTSWLQSLQTHPRLLGHFAVMPGRGVESTLKGKDWVHVYNINSTFDVISNSGMRVDKTNYALILVPSENCLQRGIRSCWNSDVDLQICLFFFTTGFNHCDPGDSDSWPQRLLPVLDWPEQGETPRQEGQMVWSLQAVKMFKAPFIVIWISLNDEIHHSSTNSFPHLCFDICTVLCTSLIYNRQANVHFTGCLSKTWNVQVMYKLPQTAVTAGRYFISSQQENSHRKVFKQTQTFTFIYILAT